MKHKGSSNKLVVIMRTHLPPVSTENGDNEAVQEEHENGEPSLEQYWEIFGTSSQDDLHFFLQLFVPNSGMLSKKKELEWATIQSKKVLPLLSVS
jgi:hypothetical protein